MVNQCGFVCLLTVLSTVDPGTSRLSIISTSASENQTLNNPDGAGDVPLLGDADGHALSEKDRDDTNAVNRVTIIEELDTPAIRRQKNLLRKAEKRRLANASSTTRPPPPPLPHNATPRSPGNDSKLGSDLSSLSDSESDEGEAPIKKPLTPRGSKSTMEGFETSRHPLEGGTLGIYFFFLARYRRLTFNHPVVWAKAGAYDRLLIDL